MTESELNNLLDKYGLIWKPKNKTSMERMMRSYKYILQNRIGEYSIVDLRLVAMGLLENEGKVKIKDAKKMAEFFQVNSAEMELYKDFEELTQIKVKKKQDKINLVFDTTWDMDLYEAINKTVKKKPELINKHAPDLAMLQLFEKEKARNKFGEKILGDLGVLFPHMNSHKVSDDLSDDITKFFKDYRRDKI